MVDLLSPIQLPTVKRERKDSFSDRGDVEKSYQLRIAPVPNHKYW